MSYDDAVPNHLRILLHPRLVTPDFDTLLVGAAPLLVELA